MNTGQLLEHFDRLSEAPGAVPRLRRFILDLAVRGKLVSQDAGDEPVVESISPAESDDPLHTIPTSWIWARISQLTDMVTDGEHLTPPRIFERQVPLVTAKNVRDGEMDYGTTDWVSNETAEKAWRRCRPTVGDILMVCVGATTGRLCILRKHLDMVLVRSVAVIRPAKNILEDFLAIAIRSPFGQRQIWSSVKVTAQPCLYINRINSLAIPVPPLAEQYRIVAKVDELMALCDQLEAAQQERERRRDRLAAASLQRLNQPAADTTPEAQRAHARFHLHHLPRLTTRPEHVKAMRQLLLNLAVRGKLLSQDSRDVPASELLQRIHQEKLKQQKGSKRPEVKLRPVDLTSVPFDLPSGWAWARFPEVGTFGRGKSKHRPRNDSSLYSDGTHMLIQTGDVARSKGVIKTFTNKYNDIGLAQSMKWPAGTLCITIAANIADSGILSFDACFPDSVVGFKASALFDSARYFEYFVRTAKANLLAFAPATAQKNINLEILNAVLIPLPPLAEQHRIVAKVDELMALCDQLEAQLTTTQTDSSRLSEAVLEAALAPT